jgi:hypothetical protein
LIARIGSKEIGETFRRRADEYDRLAAASAYSETSRMEFVRLAANYRKTAASMERPLPSWMTNGA